MKVLTFANVIKNARKKDKNIEPDNVKDRNCEPENYKKKGKNRETQNTKKKENSRPPKDKEMDKNSDPGENSLDELQLIREENRHGRSQYMTPPKLLLRSNSGLRLSPVLVPEKTVQQHIRNISILSTIF